MNKVAEKKAPFAAWHKAVLVGCLVLAVIGTLAVIGGMVKMAGTITEYGGTVGPPVYVGFFLMLLSVWLFAGSGALLVYIAKTSRDISEMLISSGQKPAAETD